MFKRKGKDHSRLQLLFIIATAMIWLKTYLVQRFVFTLPVDGWYQELILLISPISSTLLLLGVGFLFTGRRQHIGLLAVTFLTSFVLFANMVYYRFFNDFITLPVLMQSKNMGDLGSSIFELIHPYDILVFVDVAIIAWLVYGRKTKGIILSRTKLVTAFMLAIGIFFGNWIMAETVRPELLTRTFDRQIVVKSIGAYNYHIYDMVVNSKMKSKKVFASSADLMDAAKYLEQSLDEVPNPELFGIAKNRNVILISMESLQSFVINNKLFDEEITPFLNELIQDSFYFENFYHQTGQGKTSDAEFLIDNSLYPLPSGAVYFTHAQNTYYGTPNILKEKGYYSAVFHANDKSFWNRDLMYQTLGYDRFYSITDYEVTPENSVGWGLKDIDFFEQSIPLMKELPQPFYSKFLTLTNHHPFVLDEEDKMIAEFNSGSGTLNRYFPTVRYMDEALRIFFERLKEEGLYDNSIFILYGDHYGISSNHDRSMARYLEKDKITPFDRVQLQRVPLIVHIPGVKGKTLSTVTGQIDVKPTLLHLLGIETRHGLDFGHDMFAETQPEFVVFRDGSFITKDSIYTADTCYNKLTGEPYEENEEEENACAPYMEKAVNDLKYSDEIIYGDLMRFMLEPKGKLQP